MQYLSHFAYLISFYNLIAIKLVFNWKLFLLEIPSVQYEMSSCTAEGALHRTSVNVMPDASS